MTWVRLADDFADHPKLIAAGPLAGWLWVCALAYANKHLTDGAIPGGALRRLVDADDPSRLAARLVEVGLWERTSDGYRIHDYAEYQPSAESVKAEREAAAQRMREYRERQKSGRNNPRSNGVTNSVTNSVSSGSPVPAVNPALNPDPALTSPPLPPSPQAGKGERASTRRRRRSSEGEDTPSPLEVLSPVTPEDVTLWIRAVTEAACGMTENNAEQLLLLDPIGRAPDGGLRLRAPPGQGAALGRYSSVVRKALFEAGDTQAAQVAIVEG